jgi:hypothetical protein
MYVLEDKKAYKIFLLTKNSNQHKNDRLCKLKRYVDLIRYIKDLIVPSATMCE